MATWAIGDIQGCFRTLRRLVARIGYRRGRDRLVLVGDLVNRGPDSLAALRWIRDQGDSVSTVLGNHDLHLLACHAGLRAPKGRDTLLEVLDAPDADALCDWVASRPFLHREDRFLVVHAGLLPGWTPRRLGRAAGGAAAALRADRHGFLECLYRLRGDPVRRAAGRAAPSADEPVREAAAAARVLTGIRAVDGAGDPAFSLDGPPEAMPPGHRPWFEAARTPPGRVVLFGHWSTLGLTMTRRAVCLDSGCVWNGSLTAFRLGDGAVVSVPAAPGDGRAP